MMPACRQAPPYRIQIRRASRISSAGPQSIEPIGAPRPLERQNIIVSTWDVQAVTGSPVAAAAFQIRAPSMWIGTPARSVTARTARSSSARQDRPARAADRVLDRQQVDHLDVEVVVGLEESLGQGGGHVAVRMVGAGAERDAREARARHDLGGGDMGARFGGHQVSLPADVQPQTDLVGHRAGRDVQRRLGPGQLGRSILQAVHGRIVAVPGVAHLGGGHRGPHRVRRGRDRVGAQIHPETHPASLSARLDLTSRTRRSTRRRSAEEDLCLAVEVVRNDLAWSGRLAQRDVGDVLALARDHPSPAAGMGELDGGDPEARREQPVERDGGPAALDVAQDRDPRVIARSAARSRAPRAWRCPRDAGTRSRPPGTPVQPSSRRMGSAPSATTTIENELVCMCRWRRCRQRLLDIERHLGDEQHVGAAGHGGVQRDPARMAAHHLDHDDAVVALRRACAAGRSQSVATCTAVWNPTVTSVPGRSLSIVLGTPTIGTPRSASSAAAPKRALAPDHDEPVEFVGLHGRADEVGAVGAPHRVARPSCPSIVPPRCSIPAGRRGVELDRLALEDPSPAVAETDERVSPRASPVRTAARMTAFKPGQSPPPVSTPSRMRAPYPTGRSASGTAGRMTACSPVCFRNTSASSRGSSSGVCCSLTAIVGLFSLYVVTQQFRNPGGPSAAKTARRRSRSPPRPRAPRVPAPARRSRRGDRRRERSARPPRPSGPSIPQPNSPRLSNRLASDDVHAFDRPPASASRTPAGPAARP